MLSTLLFIFITIHFISPATCLFRSLQAPHSTMKTFISLMVLGAIADLATAQRCFSMDGQALDARYQPCYPQAESSACCQLNGTQGEAQQNDLCLDSGLCQSTSGWYAGFLYINGCTDQTGKADGCPKLCSFSMWYPLSVTLGC